MTSSDSLARTVARAIAVRTRVRATRTSVHHPCDAIRQRPRRFALCGHPNAAHRAAPSKPDIKEHLMKRFHVHVAVPNLTESIHFYSTMFGSEPTVVKPDYAKWMLDDPRVNFAISQRSTSAGINHLGVQVETDEELEELHARLRSAEASIAEEKGVSCCYARLDQYR